jgi:Fe-S cluster biogenesis protein NfuA
VKAMTESIEKRVKEALEEIRPQIQADGGDIEFVAVENKTLKVRLRGACAGCPMAAMTLKQGVETLVKKRVPEISKVEAVE